jgi:hypothetical protein
MGRRGLGICFSIVLLFALGSASAQAAGENQTLAVSSASPVSGATVAPGPVAFSVTTSVPQGTSLSIEVSTQNVPGQDGTLADDFKKETVFLHQSDAYPGTFSGEALYVAGGYWWDSTPGTYYWQVSGTYFEFSGEFRTIHYISPVYTLTIAPPPPMFTNPGSPPSAPPTSNPSPPVSTLGLSEAYDVVKRIIRHKTGQRAYHLKDHCYETGAATATCKASWITPARHVSNVLIYAGTFHLEAEAGEEIGYRFKGARAAYGCIKHHRLSACASVVRW